jgi:hypothetical protein
MTQLIGRTEETLDSMPLFVEMLKRCGFQTIFDNHFKPNANWKRLSMGHVAIEIYTRYEGNFPLPHIS